VPPKPTPTVPDRRRQFGNLDLVLGQSAELKRKALPEGVPLPPEVSRAPRRPLGGAFAWWQVRHTERGLCDLPNE
jgi:hypothetical protein